MAVGLRVLPFESDVEDFGDLLAEIAREVEREMSQRRERHSPATVDRQTKSEVSSKILKQFRSQCYT